MIAVLIIWACVGLLTHVGTTFLDQAALDLRLPIVWRTFLIWLPLSALFGPLMLVGLILSPPRWFD